MPAKIITVPDFPFEELFLNYRYRPGMAGELITNGNFSNRGRGQTVAGQGFTDLGAGAQGEGAKNYRYRLVAASELI